MNTEIKKVQMIEKKNYICIVEMTVRAEWYLILYPKA